MASVIGMNYDMTIFNKGQKEYRAGSKRSNKVICDSAGGDVAANFVNLTEHSSENKIDRALGVTVGTIEKVAKTGRVTRKKTFTSMTVSKSRMVPFIYLLVNSNREKKGLAPVTGNAMAKAAMKLRNLRKRSINFIRSAGLEMGKKLWAQLKTARTRPSIRRNGGTKPLGDSEPAREDDVATTTISSFVHGSKTGDSPTADAIVQKGIAAALGAKAEDYMRIVAEREAKKNADKYNATKM